MTLDQYGYRLVKEFLAFFCHPEVDRTWGCQTYFRFSEFLFELSIFDLLEDDCLHIYIYIWRLDDKLAGAMCILCGGWMADKM